MGKYSFDNYCSYETYKIRPRSLPDSSDHSIRGTYRLLEYTWEELEPERGRFCLDRISEDLKKEKNPVLKIILKAPAWLAEVNYDQEGFSHLIRRVGSAIAQIHNIVGVILPSTNSTIRVIDAYIDSFQPISLLAKLEDEALITYLKDKKVTFGLVVHCGEDNWIDCCERFANLGLQNIWEQGPVVLEIEDKEPGINLRRESTRWHAAFANIPMEIGFSFALRRLTYPKKIIGGGGLPLRFWFVNTGSAPCYQEFYMMLRLSQGATVQEFRLNIDTNQWVPGDIVHNEILTLPELTEGNHQVSIGLFRSDGNPIPLRIEAKQENGYYELGSIDVDPGLENNLLHAWDDFYPDGYYPLEDPQAPKES